MPFAAQTADGPGIVSWNAKWLVDPHSAPNTNKRQLIRRWLDAGKIVLLQETHWTLADKAKWSTLFPAATIIGSETENSAGGVAIIVAPEVRFVRHRIVVPGYAIRTSRSTLQGAPDESTIVVSPAWSTR